MVKASAANAAGEIVAAGAAASAGPAHTASGGLESLDDATLARRLVERDSLALQVLYDRYSRPVFSLALKIISDHGVVEEVVQEVFLRLWTRAESYDPSRGKLLSWLLTITHHRAVDELRRRRSRPELEGIEESVLEGTADLADPVLSLAGIEDRETIGRALDCLTEIQRRPIELAYYGGMTQVEIAAALGLPLGTVKTRTRLGLMKLRAMLEEPASPGRNGGAPGARPVPGFAAQAGTGPLGVPGRLGFSAG